MALPQHRSEDHHVSFLGRSSCRRRQHVAACPSSKDTGGDRRKALICGGACVARTTFKEAGRGGTRQRGGGPASLAAAAAGAAGAACTLLASGWRVQAAGKRGAKCGVGRNSTFGKARRNASHSIHCFAGYEAQQRGVRPTRTAFRNAREGTINGIERQNGQKTVPGLYGYALRNGFSALA